MFKANKYDKIYNNRLDEVNFLLEYLNPGTVLDIGGGTGALSEALNEKGYDCINIEPQLEMARLSGLKGIKTRHASAEDPQIDGKYDNVIMMFDVFNFLKNPEKALENIRKLLKGKLIFTYWNSGIKKSGWEFNWKLMRLSRKVWFGDKVEIDFWFPFFHEKHNMTVYSDKWIKELLRKKGFKIIEKFETKYNRTLICV